MFIRGAFMNEKWSFPHEQVLTGGIRALSVFCFIFKTKYLQNAHTKEEIQTEQLSNNN